MLNLSLEGVLIYPSLVVAPINVNLGNDMFILLADCPSPITMSIIENPLLCMKFLLSSDHLQIV